MGKYYALAKRVNSNIDLVCSSLKKASLSINRYIDTIPKKSDEYDIFARNVYENISNLDERINSICESLEEIKNSILSDGKRIDDEENEVLRQRLETLKKKNNNITML